MSKFRDTKRINQIIIHCADTPNGKIFTAEDIDQWHKSRGFHRNTTLSKWSNLKHIGYHFVIHLNGSVLIGRQDNETGAHAKHHNLNSIGICLIGRNKFTPQQWDSLKELTLILQRKHTRIDAQNIIGHRQVNEHKSCPNFSVQNWLGNQRQALPDHILEETL